MRKKWRVLPLVLLALLLTGCAKQVQPDIRLPETEAAQPMLEDTQEEQGSAEAGTPAQLIWLKHE